MLVEHIDELRKISDEELQRRHEALNHYIDMFIKTFQYEGAVPQEWQLWLDQIETELFERACRDK